MSRTPPAWPRPDGAGAASAPTSRSPSGPPSRVGAKPQRARVRRPSSAPPWGRSTGHRRTAASQAARATAPEARGAARSARCRCADASHPGPRGHGRCSGPAVAQSSVARSSSPRRHPRWCDPALTARSPERAAPRSDPGPTGASLPDPLRSDDQQPAPWLASAPHGAPAYPLLNHPGILNPSPSPGVGITLIVGLTAHRASGRVLLMGASVVMLLTGIAFAVSQEFWPLLLVAFVGTLNPSTGDVSVFLPLEQAQLAHLVSDRDRTRLFARYSFVGS